MAVSSYVAAAAPIAADRMCWQTFYANRESVRKRFAVSDPRSGPVHQRSTLHRQQAALAEGFRSQV